MHSHDDGAGLRRVEAARYALLQRLTLAMRHQMVVHLQPIGMLSELMERRLRGADPDFSLLGEDMEKVQDFARAGVGASLDFVTWLAPEPGTRVPLQAGVTECVALLRTQFSFRGITLRHDLDGWSEPVSQSALRVLVPAVLFGIADEGVAPTDLTISATRETGRLQLRMRSEAGQGSEGFAAPAGYRELGWDEVEALAVSEGVGLARDLGQATLSWPLA
jgi:hypothetical protein